MVYEFYGQLGKLVRLFEKITWPAKPAPRKALPGHTLYHFYVSPYSRRVRKAIHHLNLEVPSKDVLLDSAAHSDLVKFGGKNQVPCLRIETKDGSRWMYESAEIVAYLSSAAAPAK